MPESTPDEELQSWLDSNAEDYRLPDIYTLEQVYMDPARYDGDMPASLEALRQRLAAGEISADEASDSTMLPTRLERVSSRDIGRSFGSVFLDALANLPTDSWTGPVRSGFGIHLVRLVERQSGKIPTLEEARQAVERDYLQDQVSRADEAFYQALRARYKVTIEADALNSPTEAP